VFADVTACCHETYSLSPQLDLLSIFPSSSLNGSQGLCEVLVVEAVERDHQIAAQYAAGMQERNAVQKLLPPVDNVIV
jgi:hypothetical protein